MSDEKRTRRPNLESTISTTPNKDGLYEAKVWMGTKANGRPDRRHVQRKSLAAVRARVKQLEKQRDDGLIVNPGRPPTIREMLTRHIDVVLPSRKRSPGTIASYRSLCTHQIFPRWGEQRADRLTPEHIEDGYADMLERGLATSSVRKVHAVLSSAYELQVSRGNLLRNPCQFVTAPAAPEGEMPLLTVAEAASLAEAAKAGDNGMRWALGLGHGLRQGEALGLRWEYLNLDTGQLRVWYQLQRDTWRHGCGEPHKCAAPRCKKKPCPKKCKRHTRACPLPCPPDCTGHASRCPERKGGGLVFRKIKDKLLKTLWLGEDWTALLREHRDAQYLRRLAADTEWQEHDLVFCQWNGRPVDPRRDWADWKQLLLDAGLPPHRVHATRHTSTSLLLGEGVGIRVAQKMLGHANLKTTEGYAHVFEEQMRDASARAAKALRLSPKRTPAVD